MAGISKREENVKGNCWNSGRRITGEEGKIFNRGRKLWPLDRGRRKCCSFQCSLVPMKVGELHCPALQFFTKQVQVQDTLALAQSLYTLFPYLSLFKNVFDDDDDV